MIPSGNFQETLYKEMSSMDIVWAMFSVVPTLPSMKTSFTPEAAELTVKA